MYNKINQNHINKTVYPHKSMKQRYLTVTYNKTINKKIQPISKSQNIQIAHNNNLRDILSNNRIKTTELDKSGVYKINCEDCECFYIGQSGRAIKQRLKEHIRGTQSAMSNHLRDNGHTINNNSIKLLHNQVKSKKLDLLEEYEIFKHGKANPEHILNDQTFANHRRLFTHIP